MRPAGRCTDGGDANAAAWMDEPVAPPGLRSMRTCMKPAAGHPELMKRFG